MKIQKYIRLEILCVFMELIGGVDPGIKNLKRDYSMTQIQFIAWLLKRHDKMFTNQLAKNWNAYKTHILGYSNECRLSGFRRAIWQLHKDGFLERVPKPKPTTRTEELFGKTLYRLAPGRGILMKCAKCGNDILLQCSDDSPERIDGEPVCKDCYFRELGDMMEQHPPGIHPKYPKSESKCGFY